MIYITELMVTMFWVVYKYPLIITTSNPNYLADGKEKNRQSLIYYIVQILYHGPAHLILLFITKIKLRR